MGRKKQKPRGVDLSPKKKQKRKDLQNVITIKKMTTYTKL